MTDERQEDQEQESPPATPNDAALSPSGGRSDTPKPTDHSEDGSTDAVGQTGEPKAH